MAGISTIKILNALFVVKLCGQLINMLILIMMAMMFCVLLVSMNAVLWK